MGSVNADIVVRVKHLPGRGETVTGGVRQDFPGGKGANQASAAARAGAPVAIVGAVGDDDAGTMCRRSLAEEGIDVSHLLTLPGVATGAAVVVVEQSGENQIAVAPGANAMLTAAMVAKALGQLGLRRGDVCLSGFEVPASAVDAAARACRQVRARLVVNPAPPIPLSADVASVGAILTPNEAEIAFYVPGAQPSAAASTLAQLVRGTVAVTLGGNGVVLATEDGIHHLPAIRVDVVDTTGAGDAFTGILCTGLAAGLTFEAAAKRAVAGAALSVGAMGARDGLPTALQIDGVVGTS